MFALETGCQIKDAVVTRVRNIPGLVLWVGLMAGCASVPLPLPHEQLASAPKLEPSGACDVPFRFRRASADSSVPSRFVIDPVTIYDGADAQFGGVSPEDRNALAGYMHQTFAEVLGEKGKSVAKPELDAGHIHLTILGIEHNTPVVSTVSHLLPIGLIINAFAQAGGQPGTFLGSVSYAVEVVDSSGELIYACVTRQAPAALDIGSSVGFLDAAKAGVRLGAKQLRNEVFPDSGTNASPASPPNRNPAIRTNARRAS
jgi:hypothetical protein